MSVMSAAEARQAAGASPEIPPQPLRIARSEDGQDDAAAAATLLNAGDDLLDAHDDLLDAGDETFAEPGPIGRSASSLRVTQVRMVREIRVAAVRAEGSRPVIVPHPRAARARTAAPRAGAEAQARMAAQARAAMRTQAAAHVRVPGQAAGAGQAQAATGSRTASQVRASGRTWVARQARTGGRTWVARQARTGGRARVAGQARVTTRPGAVRLTRRGRRVVAGFVIAVVIVAVTVLWMCVAGSVQASSHGSAPGSPYRGMTQVVVRPGQTLWSIAAAAEPSGNAWAVVQQIINVNALSSANVQAGQLLWVPAN